MFVCILDPIYNFRCCKFVHVSGTVLRRPWRRHLVDQYKLGSTFILKVHPWGSSLPPSVWPAGVVLGPIRLSGVREDSLSKVGTVRCRLFLPLTLGRSRSGTGVKPTRENGFKTVVEGPSVVYPFVFPLPTISGDRREPRGVGLSSTVHSRVLYSSREGPSSTRSSNVGFTTTTLPPGRGSGLSPSSCSGHRVFVGLLSTSPLPDTYVSTGGRKSTEPGVTIPTVESLHHSLFSSFPVY